MPRPFHLLSFGRARTFQALTLSGDSGQRWLQGTFVNADDAMGRLCSLRVNRPSGGRGDSAASYLTRFGNGSLPRVC